MTADALIVLDEAEGSDEDEEEEEEERVAGVGVADELPCPFCGEELDTVGLLCHMEDEHHAEANAGVLSLRKLAIFSVSRVCCDFFLLSVGFWGNDCMPA